MFSLQFCDDLFIRNTNMLKTLLSMFGTSVVAKLHNISRRAKNAKNGAVGDRNLDLPQTHLVMQSGRSTTELQPQSLSESKIQGNIDLD